MPYSFKNLLLACIVVTLAACGGSESRPGNPTTDGTNNPNEPIALKIDPDDARLKPGLGCDAYRDYLVDTFVEKYVNSVSVCLECPLAAVASDAGEVAAPAPTTVSDTNIQEENVGEADVVKADANGNLYVADHNRLHVIDGFAPQAMNVLATLPFEQTIRNLILDEARQRLIVIFYPQYNYQIYPNTPSDAVGSLIGIPSNESTTTIKFFDIQDLSTPVEIDSITHTGFIHTERYVDGALYLLSWNYVNDPVGIDSDFWPLLNSYHQAIADGDEPLVEELRTAMTNAIQTRIDAQAIEYFLPAFLSYNPDGTVNSNPSVTCEDIYAPNVSVDPRLVTAYKFDANGTSLDALAMMTTISDAYVSANNLYIYQSSNNWWWWPNQASESAIHQISYASGEFDYRGVGMIPGTVNNRFSFSEHNGHLRVASTEFGSQGDALTTVNHLNVLALGDQGTLQVVGSSPEYATDERIFSARFLGNRGYVVTFRQIDPLFTFDLSIPTAPQLVGELEIPGFSEYIHPISDSRLLTIGQNGDQNGTLPGVRLQLFDVSDLSSPTLLHSHVPTAMDGGIDYAWSAASYDHRAFNYVPDLQLLTIPLRMYSATSNTEDFSGFVTLAVNDADGFTEVGRLDHAEHLNLVVCVQSPCVSDTYYGVDPKRTIVMQDNDNAWLYTFSNRGVIATHANDPAIPIAMINFMDYPLGLAP